MKKKMRQYAATGIFILISVNLIGQDNTRKIPRWVSSQGYWVVEDNRYQPLQHTIRFYNNENTLVAAKDINGKKLNLKKRRTKMKLKSMLESSLLAWAAQKSAADTALAHQP